MQQPEQVIRDIPSDISQMSRFDLIYLLEKMQQQQQELERQNQHLKNALVKIDKDLSAARDAQMSLLPKELRGVQPITFRARFFPSQYVSGDIYNIFRLDENNIGLYHIDISGHGVPAALFSVSLSQILNTNVSQKNLLKIPVQEPPYYKINPPDQVIAALNEDHYLDKLGIYFTMLYMIIDIKNNRIRYTRAGHNPPIIVRQNGHIEIPKSGGLPVGLDFPREDTVVELDMEKGDRVYLYSDGISEAVNESEEQYSTARIVNIVDTNRALPLDDVLDRLISDVKSFTGHESIEDDISLIGLSFNG